MATPKLLAEFERLYGPTPLPTMSKDGDWGLRFPRTRKEAGIAHLELEKTPPPIKSFSIPLSVIVEFNIGFWVLFGPFLAIATGYWH